MKKTMGSQYRLRTIAGVMALGLLTSCAGSPVGNNVQQSLEADPQLEESPPFQTADAETASADRETTPDESASALNDKTDTEDESAVNSGDRTLVDTARADTDAERDESASEEEGAGATVSLAGIPADLQSYIRDLQAIGVLQLPKTDTNGEKTSERSADSPFSETITRREFARWLFDSYNTIYADEPGERLRPGTPSDEPAFQDVSSANPDFAAIQGLAEAGIIPSAFTGNSTEVNFRPNAPLVREDLLLWKVPLDIQSALPTTTPEAVTESWGFQDTASIDPLALRAIAADFQLGDFSNFRRAFGYTTLFRPDKAVSRAEAAAVLWRFGNQTEGRTAAEVTAENPTPER